jgi:hypothetical protein
MSTVVTVDQLKGVESLYRQTQRAWGVQHEQHDRAIHNKEPHCLGLIESTFLNQAHLVMEAFGLMGIPN